MEWLESESIIKQAAFWPTEAPRFQSKVEGKAILNKNIIKI